MTTHLPPLCLEYLRLFLEEAPDVLRERNAPMAEAERPVELNVPRGYAPLARFLLLGDW